MGIATVALPPAPPYVHPLSTARNCGNPLFGLFSLRRNGCRSSMSTTEPFPVFQTLSWI